MRTPLRLSLALLAAGLVISPALAQPTPAQRQEEIRKFEAAVKAAEARLAEQQANPPPPPSPEVLAEIARFREAVAEAEERWAIETTGLTPAQQAALRGAVAEAKSRPAYPALGQRNPFGFPANSSSPFRSGTFGMGDTSAPRSGGFTQPSNFFAPVGSTTRGGTLRPR
jgi:hypothetical protein